MGRFRNKAIETEWRRVLYSSMKGAHCTKSPCPAGPLPLASPFSLFPSWGFVRGPQDARPQAVLSSHLPVSAAPGLPRAEGELGWEPPLTFSAPRAKSVVVGDESASFREGWGQTASSQAAARGGRAGSKKTVDARKLCTEASPPPPPKKSAPTSPR